MKCQIVGITALKTSLKNKAKLEAAKTVVKMNGSRLDEKMKDLAEPGKVYNKGYSVGDTRDSVSTEISGNGLTVTVGPSMEYNPYVEFGTRFMTAEPVVKPAYEEVKQKFIKDMKKLGD